MYNSHLRWVVITVWSVAVLAAIISFVAFSSARQREKEAARVSAAGSSGTDVYLGSRLVRGCIAVEPAEVTPSDDADLTFSLASLPIGQAPPCGTPITSASTNTDSLGPGTLTADVSNPSCKLSGGTSQPQTTDELPLIWHWKVACDQGMKHLAVNLNFAPSDGSAEQMAVLTLDGALYVATNPWISFGQDYGVLLTSITAAAALVSAVAAWRSSTSKA
jgi:hypothetical protein